MREENRIKTWLLALSVVLMGLGMVGPLAAKDDVTAVVSWKSGPVPVIVPNGAPGTIHVIYTVGDFSELGGTAWKSRSMPLPAPAAPPFIPFPSTWAKGSRGA